MDIKIVKHSFFKHSLLVGILLFVSNLGFSQNVNLYIYENSTPSSINYLFYLHYELRYKKANEGEDAWIYLIIPAARVSDGWGELYTPYTLADLEPNQQYIVQVRGFSQGENYSAWGFYTIFTTPEPEEWNGTSLPWEIDGIEVRCGAAPNTPGGPSVLQVPDAGLVIESNKSEAIKKKEDE